MIYDLTDKLKFEENPVIRIKDKDIEVNADATTLLKMMQISDKDTQESVLEMYELIFAPKERKKIESLNPSVPDFLAIIQTAMSLIQGEDPDKTLEEEETPRVV